MKISWLGLAFAAASAPVSADWQWTKFGMTAEEVIAASDGKAAWTTDADGNPSLEAPYDASTIGFTAHFLFDESKRLRKVRLDPRDPSCNATRMLLGQQYGDPFAKDGMSGLVVISTWKDEKLGNEVTFVEMNDGDCALSYGPIESGSGL